jgi:26S proteasome regulatory subunit N6
MSHEVLTVESANEAIKAGNASKGEQILKQILSQKSQSNQDDSLKEQEAALVRLGELYRDQR